MNASESMSVLRIAHFECTLNFGALFLSTWWLCSLFYEIHYYQNAQVLCFNRLHIIKIRHTSESVSKLKIEASWIAKQVKMKIAFFSIKCAIISIGLIKMYNSFGSEWKSNALHRIAFHASVLCIVVVSCRWITSKAHFQYASKLHEWKN